MEEKLRYAFSVFDGDGDDCITKFELGAATSTL